MWDLIKKLLNNSKIAWTVCAGIVISAAVAYNVYILPTEPDVDPSDPVPAIVGIEKPIPCGELAEMKLVPYKVKPDNLETYAVDLQVLDGNKNVKLRDINGSLAFPVGCSVGKKYDVHLTVTYVFKTDGKLSVKNRVIRQAVYVEKAPNPGPDPGPGPGPDPLPKPDVDPVFPQGKFGLSKFTYDNVKNLVKSSRRGEAAKALADSLMNVSNLISNKTIKSSEEALSTAAKDNVSALSRLGIPSSEWTGFFGVLQEKLYELDNNSTFSNSVAELRTAFLEIEAGLRAIK